MEGPCHKHADKKQNNARDQTYDDRHTDGAFYPFRVATTEMARCDHVRARRQADEDTDNKVYKTSVRAYRGDGVVVREHAENEHVGRVKKTLQNVRQNNRNTVDNEFF